MYYNPKLKKAAAEIKQILEAHDIAGVLVLHSPGNSEYILHITPSYSCASLEGDTIRFRAKASDYNGNTKIRDQKIADTANMMALLSETTAHNAMQLITVSEQFDKIVDAEHRSGGHTSHTTQNN